MLIRGLQTSLDEKIHLWGRTGRNRPLRPYIFSLDLFLYFICIISLHSIFYFCCITYLCLVGNVDTLLLSPISLKKYYMKREAFRSWTGVSEHLGNWVKCTTATRDQTILLGGIKLPNINWKLVHFSEVFSVSCTCKLPTSYEVCSKSKATFQISRATSVRSSIFFMSCWYTHPEHLYTVSSV